MTSDATARLCALMDRHGIALLDYDEGDIRIRLRRGQPAALPDAAAPPTPRRALKAPAFGRFHSTHPASGEKPSVLPRKAKKGEIVAFLAIGPLLRPVLAMEDCTLRAKLVSEGTIVGFGDELYEF